MATASESELRVSTLLIEDVMQTEVLPAIRSALDAERARPVTGHIPFVGQMTVGRVIGDTDVESLQVTLGSNRLTIEVALRRSTLVRTIVPARIRLTLCDPEIQSNGSEETLTMRIAEPMVLTLVLRKAAEQGLRSVDEPLRSILNGAIGKDRIVIPITAMARQQLDGTALALLARHPLAAVAFTSEHVVLRLRRRGAQDGSRITVS